MSEEFQFTVDMDALTIDDLVDFETMEMAKVVPIIKRIVKLPGVPEEEQEARVGKLPWWTINRIAIEVQKAVEAEVNPERQGKN